MNQTEWIYRNSPDNSARYILGTKGNKTLFCFGINPSTATPTEADPTIRKVMAIADYNGYDSFIMLNVYPKRDANFEKLDMGLCDMEHRKNLEAIKKIISEHQEIDIWLAFGNHIYDRAYLPLCLKDIYESLQNREIRWFVTGTNKTGAPKHPLYEKKTSPLFGFDMASFIEKLM